MLLHYILKLGFQFIRDAPLLAIDTWDPCMASIQLESIHADHRMQSICAASG